MSHDEAMVAFNKEHHVGGLNAKFFASAEELKEKFGGPTGIFESPHREIVQYAPDILAAMKALLPTGSFEGCQLLDIGSGTGVLEPFFSEAVGPTGVVFANDLSPGFVQLIEDMCSSKRFAHANVIPVIGGDKDVQRHSDADAASAPVAIEPESLDIAFMVDVYHHLEYPVTMMKNILSLLKPDTGRLFVIDFYRDPQRMVSHPPQWALDHIRADKDEFMAEILSSGFELVSDQDLVNLKENYLLCFCKKRGGGEKKE